MRRVIPQLKVSLLLYLVLPIVSVAAHEMTDLEPGTRIRVQANRIFQRAGTDTVTNLAKRQYAGRLVKLRSDTLEMAPDDLHITLVIPLQYLEKLELHKGYRSSVGKGALIGFSAGAALGIVLGVINGGGFGDCMVTGDEEAYEGCSGDFAVIGGLLFGLPGAAAGAVAGAAAGPREVWQAMLLK